MFALAQSQDEKIRYFGGKKLVEVSVRDEALKQIKEKKEEILVLKANVHNNVVVIHCYGELDLYTVPQLEKLTNRYLDEEYAKIVIDLTETSYLDAETLRVFIRILSRVNQANLRLVMTPDALIRKTFLISGLKQYFLFTPSVQEALENLN